MELAKKTKHVRMAGFAILGALVVFGAFSSGAFAVSSFGIQRLEGEAPAEIDFDDIEVHNSIILPLLGLRCDKVLFNKPYKFKDLVLKFKLTDGVLKPDRFKLDGQPFNIDIRGQADLRGTVDFIVTTPTTIVPMRVSGPFDGPSVRPAPGARLRKDK